MQLRLARRTVPGKGTEERAGSMSNEASRKLSVTVDRAEIAWKNKCIHPRERGEVDVAA